MMKRNWMNKWMAVLVLSTLATVCFSQNDFAYKATLDGVKEDGFYKIMLTPEVLAKSQTYFAKSYTSFPDIRILAANGIQVPYILEMDSARFTESSFVEFPILSKQKNKDKQTHIILENKTGNAINDLLLITANMDAKRWISISGSHDLKDWYIIKENALIEEYFSKNKDASVHSISLPTVNYRFFKIIIIGEDILPFNIVKAGVYKESYTAGKYMEIPSPTIVQKDSFDRITYFELNFPNAYLIDKIRFEIEGPKFYKRRISIPSQDVFHLSDFSYINSEDAVLVFQSLKERNIKFIIDNNDNVPLRIKSAKAYQLNRYMLAYLEKGKQYQLAFGDPLAKAPEYDLQFFKDSIGTDIPVLSVGNIQSISPIKAAIEKPKNNNTVFLWITIAIVSILLLFFTLKMTREIKKRNNHADL
jgi:hypothetical protein